MDPWPSERRSDPGHLPVDTHGGQHVGGLLGAAGARRPGAGRDAFLLKKEEQGLTLHASEAQVGYPGGTGRAIGNSATGVWHPVDQADLQAVPQSADPFGSRGSLGGH